MQVFKNVRVSCRSSPHQSDNRNQSLHLQVKNECLVTVADISPENRLLILREANGEYIKIVDYSFVLAIERRSRLIQRFGEATETRQITFININNEVAVNTPVRIKLVQACTASCPSNSS